jgi:hypothetical protein
MARFPISYSKPGRLILGAFGLGGAWVEVDDAAVEVRMGWAFHAKFPRSSIKAAAPSDRRMISQGVHGRRGQWLVNGARRGLVRIDVAPDAEARALGGRVPLSTLEVSLVDPGALLAALSATRP